jgi:hypothetical protein
MPSFGKNDVMLAGAILVGLIAYKKFARPVVKGVL